MKVVNKRGVCIDRYGLKLQNLDAGIPGQIEIDHSIILLVYELYKWQ